MPSRSSIPADAHSIRGPISSGHFQDEVTIAAGREALRLEERSIGNAAQLRRETQLYDAPGPTSAAVRSSGIKMLFSKSQNHNGGSPVQDQVDSVGDAQGVDGLGDIRPKPVARDFRSNELDSPKLQNIEEQKMPTSVRMIVRKSEATSEESSDSDDRSVGQFKRHSKKPSKKERLHDALQLIAR
jgi:hypothetical protein